MKKLCLILILALLTGVLPSAASGQPAAIRIETCEDLLRIADAPDGDYVLTADIDMAGIAWKPIPFSGTFDGAGHTIGNLTVTEVGADTAQTYDGNRKMYDDTTFAGLFSVVTDAEIKNLSLLNVKIAIETDRDCFTGAIAGYAKNADISDCAVSVRSSMQTSAINCGVGGIVGFSEYTDFIRCSAEAELVFIDVNQDVLCEEFLGGVYAAGCANITECTAYTRGYADIYGYAHNGGMVGMFKLRYGYKGKGHAIRDSYVDAEIRFFEVTPSKRAYCDPIIGENCASDCYLTHNKTLHYDYTYERTAVSHRPEECPSPFYRTEVTEPTCTEWGYTTYTCDNCGYTYRDDYTLPRHSYRSDTTPSTCVTQGTTTYTCIACGDTYTETLPFASHTPGERQITKEPTADEAGEETLFCTVCGEVIARRSIVSAETAQASEPVTENVHVPVTAIAVDETVITLQTGETKTVSASTQPPDAERTLRYESSDPNVAAVDSEGVVTALRAGTATIRILSEDGNAEAFVSVHVKDRKETHSGFSWLRCN